MVMSDGIKKQNSVSFLSFFSRNPSWLSDFDEPTFCLGVPIKWSTSVHSSAQLTDLDEAIFDGSLVAQFIAITG